MNPALRRRLFALFVLLLAVAFLGWLRPGFERAPWAMLGLFDAKLRVENFRHMERIFPARELRASSTPKSFPRADTLLPTYYEFNGATHLVSDFLARTQTSGLLVLRDGLIVREEYRLGASADSRFTSWSVAKSVVATLVGIALKDGAIRSLDDAVTVYLPEYAGTAWEKTSLRDLLRMSSGIAFDERYDAHFSDIQRVFHATYLFDTPIREVARSYGERPPAFAAGTQFHYNSINSQVLAEVLVAATGQSLADYARDKLWQPLGMQDNALWNVDAQPGAAAGTLAFCCLNTTLRDYARLGQLYLQQGVWNGVALLPADWVAQSTRRPEPWLQAGVARPERGYGYHWWIPPGADGEYFANGIWGQSVWVDEKRRIVIVKTSVDPAFDEHMAETIAAMRGIARGLEIPVGVGRP